MDCFVTYPPYQINLASPTLTLGIIFTVLLILAAITCRKNSNVFFDAPATAQLRGAAILCLLFGHLSLYCLKQELVFIMAGYYWAVIIFLFISGHGLYRKYQMNTGFGFWKKRLLKIYPPLWITLIVFILLDYFLINTRHPLQEILPHMLGVNDKFSINPPTWFIEYILIQYVVYRLISKLPFSGSFKLAALFIFCFAIALLVDSTRLYHYYSAWLPYTFIFPAGILFGKYQSPIVLFITKYIRNRFYLLAPLFICLAVFYYWEQFMPDMFLSLMIRPLILLIPIILLLIIYEGFNLQSSFLIFLGNYSYEIFLLHWPFMIKYDFILFRAPLYISFFVYFAVLLILAYMLGKVSGGMFNNRLISGLANITNKIGRHVK
jgi:peptidoglycan/LPS O-acetylase OafA/YrhL